MQAPSKFFRALGISHEGEWSPCGPLATRGHLKDIRSIGADLLWSTKGHTFCMTYWAKKAGNKWLIEFIYWFLSSRGNLGGRVRNSEQVTCTDPSMCPVLLPGSDSFFSIFVVTHRTKNSRSTEIILKQPKRKISDRLKPSYTLN
jgi:hypothetical protein